MTSLNPSLVEIDCFASATGFLSCCFNSEFDFFLSDFGFLLNILDKPPKIAPAIPVSAENLSALLVMLPMLYLFNVLLIPAVNAPKAAPAMPIRTIGDCRLYAPIIEL
ncbi:MAG: putative transporter [Alphaproteobacteria bacterium]